MRNLLVVAIPVAASLVGGCASTTPLTAAGYDGETMCNLTRMQQTEILARRAGTRVVWVRCPRTTIEVPQPTERELG